MDEYAEENRKNLIVRSGISEAETAKNKRLRSTFCIEASRGFFATAELLVTMDQLGTSLHIQSSVCINDTVLLSCILFFIK